MYTLKWLIFVTRNISVRFWWRCEKGSRPDEVLCIGRPWEGEKCWSYIQSYLPCVVSRFQHRVLVCVYILATHQGGRIDILNTLRHWDSMTQLCKYVWVKLALRKPRRRTQPSISNFLWNLYISNHYTRLTSWQPYSKKGVHTVLLSTNCNLVTVWYNWLQRI